MFFVTLCVAIFNPKMSEMCDLLTIFKNKFRKIENLTKKCVNLEGAIKFNKTCLNRIYPVHVKIIYVCKTNKRLILGALFHWCRPYVEIYKNAVHGNILNIYSMLLCLAPSFAVLPRVLMYVSFVGELTVWIVFPTVAIRMYRSSPLVPLDSCLTAAACLSSAC